jgi:hypothetical protein
MQKAHMDLPFLFSEAMKTMVREYVSEQGPAPPHEDLVTPWAAHGLPLCG